MARTLLRRKAATGLATALVAVVFVSAGTSQARAQERWFSVRLPDGSVITVAVDAAPEATLEEIVLPVGFEGEILEEVPVPTDPGVEEPASAEDAAQDPEPTDDEEEPSAAEEPREESSEEQESSSSDRASRPDAAERRRRARARREAAARRREREREAAAERRAREQRTAAESGSTPPTPADPTYLDALPGPSTTAVPDFVIRKFRVPVFLLPIYQAAGTQYGIRWEYLAAINEIETDYGRNLNVSSAGALGWMQFMPATWKSYGVDANRDGRKDPYNPVDAIFAAARYLKAAGAPGDMRKAIFAYNHADWYVDSVVLRAKLIAGLPTDLVGSLTGLTEGRFPVAARARYTDERQRWVDIHAEKNAPVIAVADGVVRKITKRSVVLEDAYGNTFTYRGLGSVASAYPVPRETAPAAPNAPQLRNSAIPQFRNSPLTPIETLPSTQAPTTKQRLFAHPERPAAQRHGGVEQLDPASSRYDSLFPTQLSLAREDSKLKPLEVGSRVIAGTVLGRVGQPRGSASPFMRFAIRPAGRGAPSIDPKPILDGWKLLESTAIYRASGRNVLYGDDGDGMSIGQIVLLPKAMLEKRVLSDERIEIYPGGRQDIESGQIDRRVLATLAYLAESGLRPTVTSLKSGHSYLTKSGNVSHHSTGTAVDIAEINGIPVLGHQDRGGVTEQAVRRLMTLQGTLAPAQVISLLDLGGPTFAMSDHDDHIHVGWQPSDDPRETRTRPASVLSDTQWDDLIGRLRQIDQPTVAVEPSDSALRARTGSGD